AAVVMLLVITGLTAGIVLLLPGAPQKAVASATLPTTSSSPPSLPPPPTTPTALEKPPSPAPEPPPEKPADKPPERPSVIPAAPDDSPIGRLNRHRAAAGVPPVQLDSALSAGCEAHANYLVRNLQVIARPGVRIDDEDDKRPGYTADGKAAAAASFCG